ncbi:MAG: hypothetical protein FWC81_03065 [Coriobacteriia bacterium]|nr:hypothetical protein [Coriobacteriia bacterium]MCL2606351.1 hypothetical protein [Coriobacteriia bacterium]
MSKLKSRLKALGPILVLLVPLLFLLGLFMEGQFFGTSDEEYVPEGDVIYSLTNPDEYGLGDNDDSDSDASEYDDSEEDGMSDDVTDNDDNDENSNDDEN